VYEASGMVVVQLIRRHNFGQQSRIGLLLQLVVIRRDTVCKLMGWASVCHAAARKMKRKGTL